MSEEKLALQQSRVKPADTDIYRHLCDSDNREEWLKCRDIGIGASESAVIMGLSPYESVYTMFMRRTGELPPIEDNNFMEWGRRLEDVVAQKYADDTGRKVKRNAWMCQSVKYPWMTATPDYDVAYPDDPNRVGLLECKTASHFAIEDWEEDSPPHYKCQVQHQMIVTGRNRGSLACLIGGNQYRWIDEEEHQRFQQALIRKTAVFMKMVRGELPPPLPDAHPSTSETLQRMISDGRVVELPDAILAFHEGYQEACRDEKDATERKKKYTDVIKAAIGTAEYGILPEGAGSYSFKMQKGHTIVIPDGRRLRHSKKLPKLPKVQA
jgi:putative phage-type endonuclease